MWNYSAQAILITAITTFKVLGAIGVDGITSYQKIEEDWDTDYYPVYWSEWIYACVLGVGGLIYLAGALSRWYDKRATMALVISMPAVSFTIALGFYAAAALAHLLDATEWITFGLSLIGLPFGIYAIYSTRNLPYAMVLGPHAEQYMPTPEDFEPGLSMCGDSSRAEGSKGQSISMSTMGSSKGSGGWSARSHHASYTPVTSHVKGFFEYLGWPADRQPVYWGFVVGYEFMWLSVYLTGAVATVILGGSDLSYTQGGARDFEGPAITTFADGVRTMTTITYPIATGILLVTALMLKNTGAAMAAILASLFFTMRYFELFWYGIGGMALGLLTLVGISWVTGVFGKVRS